ncbi:MAG: hypothetical protein EXS36_07385 [Pedosphaera sp.]|nr:hypothetical protein [Pedosphaera sp.]
MERAAEGVYAPDRESMTLAATNLNRQTSNLFLMGDLPLSVRVPIWVAIALGLWACLAPSRVARSVWLIGGAAYLAHVCAVFHYIHHWSHSKALVHTAAMTHDVTGWSAAFGLYVNYAFTSAWVAYAIAGYLGPLPRWIRRVWCGWFLFMAFNGGIIFVLNPFRWLGVALFTAFGAATILRHFRQSKMPI